MNNLIVQVVTHNNETTIQKSLESLQSLDAHIFVLDHNSDDRTVEIASKLATIQKINHRSEGRNSLIEKGEWHLHIEPWETLGGEAAIIKAANGEPAAYRLFVSQPDLLTKEIRLWHKDTGLSYHGPIYELLEPEHKANNINALIFSMPTTSFGYNLDLLHTWQKSSPTSPTPYYYEAMLALSHFKWDDFFRLAEHFLFRCDIMSMPVVMTRYYLALAHCQVRRNAHNALKNLMICLSLKPLMAEFWCLLGDIHYFLQHDFDKAYDFYENAIILGLKRKTGDEWPVQLSKYGDYPRKMIKSIKAIKENRKLITSSVS